MRFSMEKREREQIFNSPSFVVAFVVVVVAVVVVVVVVRVISMEGNVHYFKLAYY